MRRSFGTPAALGFVLLFVVLIANTIVSYQNTVRLHENDKWVAHTQDVIAKVESILSALKDAESGQRGYVITADETYLARYRNDVVEVERIITELENRSRS
jgi:CHASE3 domain sensor protein